MKSSNVQRRRLYTFYYDKLLDFVSPVVKNKLLSGNQFVEQVSTLTKGKPSAHTKKHRHEAINQLSSTNFHGVTVPVDPIVRNFGVYTPKVHIKNSYTSPIIIPIITKKPKPNLNPNPNPTSSNKEGNKPPPTYNVMYKPEDIRKDHIIMNIIKLVDMLLKREENMDLHIKTYNIRPTSEDGGLIEIVPDCHTMYYIKEKMGFSILNYIIEHNKHHRIDHIRYRFMKSCAAYCVITYLFGIGDRHLDNIMVTNSGYLFHIDYGFILGFDPKPMANPTMRITSDVIDAIGGVNSKYYGEFKQICQHIYSCIRRHIDLFINMLSILPDYDPPIQNNCPITQERILQEILRRFVPGENYEQAELKLRSIIDRSNNNYKHAVIDAFHRYVKESTVIHGTRNIFYYLTSWGNS